MFIIIVNVPTELTKRQQQVLNFIRTHQQRKGYWPSVRDVQAHFRFKSTNAVVGHLRALETKGALVRARGQARAFRTVQQLNGDAGARHEALVDVPVFGRIAAGFPVAVDDAEEIDRIQVDAATAGNRGAQKPFALRVQGESMIDAGINDGDTVVVEPRPPRDGEIVVALIDGQSTLKRFVRPRVGSPFLQSENRAFPSIHPVAELVVQGVATALVRRL